MGIVYIVYDHHPDFREAFAAKTFHDSPICPIRTSFYAHLRRQRTISQARYQGRLTRGAAHLHLTITCRAFADTVQSPALQEEAQAAEPAQSTLAPRGIVPTPATLLPC